VQTARGRAWLILILLAAVPAVLSCARSGGADPAPGASPAGQTQATPAPSPETPGTEAKNDDSSAKDVTAEAPELKPENAAGAVKGVPAPTNTVPIVAVANYFTELPGIDVAGLKRGQKEKFLQRVNSEICSCGCKNDTLARCYVNDPRCPLVKTLVQKVYDEVKAGK
jgi:hypothetical protein